MGKSRNQNKQAVKQAVCRGKSDDTKFLRGCGGASIKVFEREVFNRSRQSPHLHHVDDHRELLELLCGMLGAEKYAEVVSLAEQAISPQKDGVDLVNSSLEVGPSMLLLSPSLTEFYQIQARAYLGLCDYPNAIKTATTGIDLAASIIAGLRGKFSPDVASLRDIQISLLETRGAAAGSSSDLEGALIDFRACVALAREAGQEFDEYKGSVENLLIAMAELNAGKPRPHHSDAEVRAWNKELGISEYSPACYVCAGCAAPPSAVVTLKACGRCHGAWYCGADCQRAGWTQHKGCCQPPSARKVAVLPDGERARVLEDVGEQGYFVARRRTGPAVVVRDAATGGLFESLSDRDVLFASDAGLGDP